MCRAETESKMGDGKRTELCKVRSVTLGAKEFEG